MVSGNNMAVNLNIMIGGEAGQGVASIGFILSRAFARGGYHVFADQDYESRIRGGHSFYRIRVSDQPVRAIAEPIDILLALDDETVKIHQAELNHDGIVVADEEASSSTRPAGSSFSVPIAKLAEIAGDKIMANTVALGVLNALLDYDLAILNTILNERFGNGTTGQANLRATGAGYDYARRNFKGAPKTIAKPPGGSPLLLINGNEAMAWGALAAGCTFMAAYPMTPSTPILEYMAGKADAFGLVVIQTEDEIAAANMITGAAFAGARAMTATSGSGFCLMVEGLGLAGITETPVVIINGQRPGPAVGLPTRTEQGDLQFVLTAHQGDFPRVVLAPASVEDAFWLTTEAFNLAEKYQTPVIILSDQHLAESYTTATPFNLDNVVIDRGALLSEADSDRLAEGYMRHLVTDSGISPRALPSQGRALVMTDSDEHDEDGHLTESAAARTSQVAKRLRKLNGLANEVIKPRVYGPKEAGLTLVGWGSSLGALMEAVDKLNNRGQSANLLHLSQLWPFPEAPIVNFLRKAKRVITVESNATGQMARLIRAETGVKADRQVLRFDGRPLTPQYIIDKLGEELSRANF
jgi:2-oxoglutarate/2-oxoacid ferredoxin oxidoreductase subunit alpha